MIVIVTKALDCAFSRTVMRDILTQSKFRNSLANGMVNRPIKAYYDKSTFQKLHFSLRKLYDIKVEKL